MLPGSLSDAEASTPLGDHVICANRAKESSAVNASAISFVAGPFLVFLFLPAYSEPVESIIIIPPQLSFFYAGIVYLRGRNVNLF